MSPPAGRTVTADELALILGEHDGPERRLVAIAGSPGAGKSTIVADLAARLNRARPGLCDVLPMDGYHLDDLVLDALGHRSRKGAPFTFDVEGLAVMLDRLRADGGQDIAVPVFDRAIEIARAGARMIAGEVRIVLVEGNYLLLDDPAWAPLRPRFDLTVMLDVPEAVLRDRLTRRWIGLGLTGAELERKLEGNDLPNMRLVLERSVSADLRLTNHAPSDAG